MRIGLLTFCQGTNYGGILQCYATHKLLEAKGHHVEEIVIAGSSSNIVSRLYNKMRTLSSPVQFMKEIGDRLKKQRGSVTSNVNKELLAVFDKFRNENLRLSPLLGVESIGEYANRHYDVIIVGSDQVWTDIYDKQSIYFIGWSPSFRGKKIALAACSAHNHVNKNRNRRLKPLLDSFNIITVRDNRTADLVESIIKKRPSIVGDPSTFYDYKEFLTDKVECPYILVYILGNEIKEGHAKALNTIKGKYGNIKVKLVTVGRCDESLCSSVDEILFACSPQDWVDMIAKAKCVYTDSFHAVLFSLKFGTPFVAYYTEAIRASRLKYLKEFYKLPNIVESVKEISIDNIYSKKVDVNSKEFYTIIDI